MVVSTLVISALNCV